MKKNILTLLFVLSFITFTINTGFSYVCDTHQNTISTIPKNHVIHAFSCIFGCIDYIYSNITVPCNIHNGFCKLEELNVSYFLNTNFSITPNISLVLGSTEIVNRTFYKYRENNHVFYYHYNLTILNSTFPLDIKTTLFFPKKMEVKNYSNKVVYQLKLKKCCPDGYVLLNNSCKRAISGSLHLTLIQHSGHLTDEEKEYRNCINAIFSDSVEIENLRFVTHRYNYYAKKIL